MRQLPYVRVLFLVLMLAAPAATVSANCIAHQPANMRFTPPADLPLSWSCVTAGPLYEHERRYFLVTFKVTNHGEKRTEALKMQANVVDTFGDVLLSVPIVESAHLGKGDSDGAVFAFRPPFPANSVDHVSFYVLAVKWSDGTVWKAPAPPKTGTIAGAGVALQRFSMRWNNYDIGSEIVPSPSPSPTRSP
jgi:hypothetical protein